MKKNASDIVYTDNFFSSCSNPTYVDDSENGKRKSKMLHMLPTMLHA